MRDPADRDALVQPREALGVTWQEDAVAAAIDASGGHPYFLQTYGKFIWDYARTSPVTREDADTGGSLAKREIDAGLYLARWSRATPAQRQMLRAIAMSGDGVDVPVADIARRLSRKRSDLGVARDQLIKKGLVYAPERGLLTFTVPGMADFVARQAD